MRKLFSPKFIPNVSKFPISGFDQSFLGKILYRKVFSLSKMTHLSKKLVSICLLVLTLWGLNACSHAPPCLTDEECAIRQARRQETMRRWAAALGGVNQSLNDTSRNLERQWAPAPNPFQKAPQPQPVFQPMRNCWQDMAGFHCM